MFTFAKSVSGLLLRILIENKIRMHNNLHSSQTSSENSFTFKT